MKKFLKWVLGILGVVVLLAIVAFVLLVTFVSPNRLKPLITDQVKKTTGRELKIDGDLSWTIFPVLGVKVGHLELSNPSEFQQKIFAEIDSATVAVKIIPLLHAKVESSGITLKGMKLFLIKNANGKTNWEDLQKSSATKTSDESSSALTAKKASIGLAVSGVDITNATISWANEQAKQYFDINHFELHAKNITLTKPFLLHIAFDFVGKNPVISGSILSSSQISLNLSKQIFALGDLDLTAKINKDAKTYNINIKGDLAADMIRQKLQLDNFAAQMANLTLTGKVKVNDFTTNPKTTGHLQVQPFDVKKLLQATGQDVPALQTCKDLGGDFDFSATNSLQSVNLQGNVKIDEVVASKIHVTNIAIQTHLEKGILTLVPITAAFYQGNLEGQSTINLNSSVPQIAVQAKLINVQAAPLLADLAAQSKFKIKGAGNIDVQVITSGINGDAIVKNLNGTTRLSFNNGILEGIDVGYYIDSAYALANKQSPPGKNTNETPFGTLTATAAIHNGVVTNNDLYINSPRFDTKGNGIIDIVNQTLNYHLQTSVKQTNGSQKNNLQNLYGMAIPISATGKLNNPSIRLEVNVLMKAIAQQQLEKAKSEITQKVQEKIQDQIKGQIPDEIKKQIPEKANQLLNNILGH